MICDWTDPGHDRYTGTVVSAIAAYHLPLETQSALIRAFEAREFTDTIVIDRDTIRGKTHEYAPDTRAMHFGSRGRRCDTVTRTGWAPDHVETALVVCAGGECIAWPAVCGNVFRLSKLAEAGTSTNVPAHPPKTETIPTSVPEHAPGHLPTPEPVLALEQTPQFVGPLWYAPGFAPPGTPGFTSPGAPIGVRNPVPEPATWLLLLSGIMLAPLLKRARRG